MANINKIDNMIKATQRNNRIYIIIISNMSLLNSINPMKK